MSMLKHFVENVASGIASVVTEQWSVSAAADMVKTCCQEIGWVINEHINANDVCLYFNDPLAGVRKVWVTIGGQGATVGFTASSLVTIPAEQVPAVALAYLLERNSQRIVTWQMSTRDNGNVLFQISYVAFVAGLNHGVFKAICEAMILEAQEFDARMRKAGLLR
jgi:hypothetical protein